MVDDTVVDNHPEVKREVFHHANLTESVTQYNPAAMDYVNKMGGPTQQHLAMIDRWLPSRPTMMSTIDYFWVLGWGFMALIIIIWFTRPPVREIGYARRARSRSLN